MNKKPPKLKSNINWKNITLTTEEAFILSRIDGLLSKDEIAACCNITQEKIDSLLLKFYKLGLIEWDCPKQIESPIEEKINNDVTVDLPTNKVELTSEQIKEIDNTFDSLSLLNFYDLFGISKTAQRSEIRTAYFTKSKTFHPDRSYGKNIGEYKKKLEKIFHQLTVAYDVLSNKDKKKQYDEYLITTQLINNEEEKIKKLDQQKNIKNDVDDLEVQFINIIDNIQKNTQNQTDKNLNKDQLSKFQNIKQDSKPTKPASSELIENYKKNLIKNNLMEISKAKEKQQKQQENSEAQYNEKMAEEFSNAGKLALENGDFTSAANSFMLAMRLNPQNKNNKQLYEQASSMAKDKLAQFYFNQGIFELSLSKFDSAKNNLIKAADMSPDNHDFNINAAKVILQIGKDLHTAQKYASNATRLQPDNAEYHAILAEIYQKAGLSKNAKREIELALKIDPKNKKYQSLNEIINKNN